MFSDFYIFLKILCPNDSMPFQVIVFCEHSIEHDITLVVQFGMIIF